MFKDIPEKKLEPPEDFYVTADCGHEIYEGAHLITWNGGTLCESCFEAEIDDLPLLELALLLGGEVEKVVNRNKWVVS